MQNASLKWIGTAVNSLFSDIDFFLQRAKGNAIPSGVLLNNLKSNSLTIGSDVNISALADQLAEAYIPKSSTVIASGGLLIDISPDPAATAAANAAARQQLVQSFSDQLQTLRSGASGISYGLAHQTLDGHTIDSITHFWASGAQQYQQTADTSPSGAINVAISGVGDVANFSGAAINISNDSSATVNGNSNYIKAGSGSLTALYGTGNVAKLVSNSGAVVQFYTANSTNTVKGSGNYIGVFATGESFNSSGNVFQFSQHGFGFSVTGDSNRIQLGGSSQSTLYGTGNLVEFIPGSGSLLHLTQANASNTVNGAGNTIGVLANGQNIASSGNVFNFSQGGFSIGIHGDSNWINAGASSGTGLYGTGNVVNFVPGSGSLVNLGTANAGTTVYGAGNTVGILATGQSVFTSGNAFSFSQGGYVTGIHGDSNWVSAGAGSYTGLYGVGNVANLVPGSGSLVHLYTAGATNTVYGAGNTVGILATGQTVVASGDAFSFSQGGFHTTIHGDSNWVNAGAGSYTGLFGNGNVANLVSGSGSLVHLYTAGATNTVYGAGNTVGILATGQTVVASGDAFNFSQGGFHTTIHGDSNWVNAGAGSYTGLFGNGNVANLVSGSGSLVHLYTVGATNTVKGGGNTVGILATGQGIASSGNTFNFSANGFTAEIYGDSNWVNAGASSYTGLFGNGNVANLVSSSGSLVHLYTANAANTVNGAGNIIGILASGQHVNASGDTFNFSQGGFTTGVNGTNNAFNLPSNSGSTINFAANSSGTVNGTGNAIGICGNNDTVNSSGNTFNFAQGGYQTTIHGDSNWINPREGSRSDVYGYNNVISMQGGNSFAHLYRDDSTTIVNGAQNNGIAVHGNNMNINTNGNFIGLQHWSMSANINGNYNAIVAENSTVHVSGSNNTISGRNDLIFAAPNSTIYVDAPDCTIVASNCTIVLGRGTDHSTIRINGNNNRFSMAGNWTSESQNTDLHVRFNGHDNIGSWGWAHIHEDSGYRNGSPALAVGGQSYGAIGAQPQAFPYFGPISSGSSSAGGVSSSGWTTSSGYNYSKVYTPQFSAENEILPEFNVLVIGVGPYPKSAPIVAQNQGVGPSYADLLHDSSEDLAFERFMNNVTAPTATPAVSSASMMSEAEALDILMGKTWSDYSGALNLEGVKYAGPSDPGMAAMMEQLRHAELSSQH